MGWVLVKKRTTKNKIINCKKTFGIFCLVTSSVCPGWNLNVLETFHSLQDLNSGLNKHFEACNPTTFGIRRIRFKIIIINTLHAHWFVLQSILAHFNFFTDMFSTFWIHLNSKPFCGWTNCIYFWSQTFIYW